ncbi:TetR/AcrR family transcriptional regulator [Subtercola boreus]|uniref:TetR family transcriptional regulator n=1 Tax=Subtercola boreus TaxID=120213 RepID=A0A3E0W695_9MICO|nr:TetR/AcrR family transcriptional regulator [Subtercola boreus]RFA17981.1 TetR family transcriptional regulator [Subtercola boreus]RFA18363.1 TetR family transcriptional regulator [Subtercola boreus]RFA24892.1 TetR family transcriptional regulator [Subtercola boreus]
MTSPTSTPPPDRTQGDRTQGGRTPRRDATENRVAILDSARLLLNRDPDTSLDAIASGAGLSRRALYGHFATRDELIAELLASGSARITDALSYFDPADSRVAIALIGARLWSEVENVRVMAQVAIRGPQRHLVARTLSPVRHRLLSVVTTGVAAGELRQDIAPATLAPLIEGAALSVLDEAVRSNLSNAEGHRLVMLAGLATAGLSWREAAALIEEHAELRFAEEKTA